MARCDRQLNAAERRAQVVELRVGRKMTFEQIGRELGVSTQRAHVIWTDALNRAPVSRIAEHRAEAIRFVDAMVAELLVAARGSIGRVLADIHRQIAVWEEHKARLLGTYQPVKRELTVVTEDAIDREIARLRAELDAQIGTAAPRTASTVK